MPNSISYEGGKHSSTYNDLQEWTIPPLNKWISGEALPVYNTSEVTADTGILDVDGKPISVNIFNSGSPIEFVENFKELDVEFKHFCSDLLTKFLHHNLITQLVNTKIGHMDFDNYHGSWSASYIEATAFKEIFKNPPSLLNTFGLYILIPNDPKKVNTDGLRVMYRQAQTYNMEYYAIRPLPQRHIQRNEILTVVFPPLAPSPVGSSRAERGKMFKSHFENAEWEYDTEPISQAWLEQQVAEHHVLMVLGERNSYSICLNWNLNQLHQLLSKITLSSRAS